MDYLRVIAAETHPIGSNANQKVRDYLVEELTALGLSTFIESGHIKVSWGGNYKRSAYIENVIATLPGSDPNGKVVALAAHYDSVFEGPGAADDGYAVASMIETVKLLKDQPRKNDIQLIITDGEEMGLLGARYHVKKNDMANVGILLNYEARGNEGPCISFEWSDNNAWLVREMKKSSIRPIASSLSYEVYKLMTNDSDFTAFQDNELPGINHAFIDGFSYYHNPADNIENISLESVQHTGENMYLMTKHFANYDFSEIEKGNASFFNFYGLLIHYPSSWDLFLMMLLGIVYIVMAFTAHKQEDFSVLSIGKALLLIILAIILIGAINFGLSTLLKSVYPQYATFYSYHYYNHEWYFITGLGVSLTVLVMMSRWIIPSVGRSAHGHALFILMALLSIALYATMTTGTYVMLLPALGFGLSIMLTSATRKEDKKTWLIPLIYIFFLVGLWTFLSHSLFLAFSLDILPGAVLFFSIAVISTMYLIPSIWNSDGRNIILGTGLLLIFGSLVIAHIKTTPSEREPLLTNLKYVYDTENQKNYVATFDDHIHEGHLGLLDDAVQKRLPRPLPYSAFYKEIDIDLSSYQSTVRRDSVELQNVQQYTIQQPKRANIAYVSIPDVSNVDSLFFNGKFQIKVDHEKQKNYYTTVYGFGLDSLQVKMTMLDQSKPIKAYINMEYSELPEEKAVPHGMAWHDPVTVVSHVIGNE